jgi:uncharacterized damage-inducible protein DinB
MPDPSNIENYETGAKKVSQAIEGLTRDDLLTFPVPGTWSIQQIVLHLADSEQVFADRMKRVIAEDNPALLAYDENKWTASLHYPAQSAADAAAMIELTRRQMARVLRSLPESAFERKGIHSQAGPVSLRELVGKAAGHLEHHLKFIVEKRKKLGR